MKKRNSVLVWGLALVLCLAGNAQTLAALAYTSSTHDIFVGPGDIAVDAHDNILISYHSDGVNATIGVYDNNFPPNPILTDPVVPTSLLTIGVVATTSGVWSSALDVNLKNGNITLATDATTDASLSQVITVNSAGIEQHRFDVPISSIQNTYGGAVDNDGDFWRVAPDFSFARGELNEFDFPSGTLTSYRTPLWTWNTSTLDFDHDNDVMYIGGASELYRFVDPNNVGGALTNIASHNPNGDPGTFNGDVTGLAVRHGRIFASDYGNDRINIFDAATGDFIQDLAVTNPYNITVDSVGNIYVALSETSELVKFTIPELACDFDGGGCGISDINLMFMQGNLTNSTTAVPPTDGQFDMVNNNIIDSADIGEWLSSAAMANSFGTPYRRGDTDLDRDVDITDFNTLSINFRPAATATSHLNGDWDLGNVDGDGDIDITDFNALSSNFMPGGYGGSSSQIPEPSTFLLCVLGLIGAGVLLVSKRR